MPNLPDRKYVLPTVDFVFKRIFGNPKNTTSLKSLLEALLHIQISKIKIENPELLKASSREKGVRLDVLATLQNYQKVNIEIQVVNEGNVDKRSLYYASRIVAGQDILGKDYYDLVPVISIFLLDFIWFKDIPDFEHTFIMSRKNSHQPLFSENEMFEMHFIEFPKFNANQSIKNSTLKKWMTFFKAKNDSILEELKMSDNTFEHAVSELEYAKMNPKSRRLYDAHLAFISDQVSGLSHAKREGEKKGIEIGEKKGLEIGEKKGIEIGKFETFSMIVKNQFPDFPKNLINQAAHASAKQLDKLILDILSQKNKKELELQLKKLAKQKD